MKQSPKRTKKQTNALETFLRDGSRSGREVRRSQTVLLVDQEVRQAAITTVTGYKRRQAFALRKQYALRGIEALKDNRKGKPNELLTKAQRSAIIATIRTKKPADLGTYYQHDDDWTTGVLGAYIKRTYHAEYKSRTSQYLLCKPATFTYHKPGKVSQRRSDEEVQKWQVEAKKRIQKAWNDPDTVILAEDEMHLSTQTTVQKIWLPKGEYPKIAVARKREARSSYGFLNNQDRDGTRLQDEMADYVHHGNNHS